MGVGVEVGFGGEDGHEFLEEGLAWVPLLGEGEVFELAGAADAFDELIGRATRVVGDFHRAAFSSFNVEAVDDRETIEPMLGFELLAVVTFNNVYTGPGAVESACGVGRYVASNF